MSIRFLTGLVLALAAALGTVSPARADPPIWRVRDANTELVLFGSVHALPEGVQWRTAALDEALAGADLVVFEILTPKTEEEEAASFEPFLDYFFSAQPLSERVSAETYARAYAIADSAGFPAEGLELLHPWAAAMMLQIGREEAMGRSSDLGVDTLIEGSLPPGQRTEALDTDALMVVVFQTLAETNDVDGEAMLVEVLDELESMHEGEALDMTIENAWVAGDIAPLVAEVADMKREEPRFYKVMMIDRNVAWMQALTRMMETETRVVVIVGAAHMMGEDGLPALLRAAGYDVEGP